MQRKRHPNVLLVAVETGITIMEGDVYGDFSEIQEVDLPPDPTIQCLTTVKEN